ncbi:MAG TPA: hypothetical protein VFP98_05640, partial [Candidatus Polarisedimenticolia bacterium]|nr:hypothetical protein [Candidatus Polarisedimenticolia bacterium]
MCADRRPGAGLGARVAFFGSSTLLAREIRSLMEGRAFGTTEVRLYDRQAEGAIGEFAGEALL